MADAETRASLGGVMKMLSRNGKPLAIAMLSVAIGLPAIVMAQSHAPRSAAPAALTASDIGKTGKSVATTSSAARWAVPDIDKLPNDQSGKTIRYGRDLVVRTYALIGPEVAAVDHRFAGNNLACASCHLEAGTKKYGLPFQGVYSSFPNYRARSGAVGTIEDRVNGCMTRSMNGRKLPLGGQEMTAIVAYLKFLSPPRHGAAAAPGRGPGTMPELTRAANPQHGKAIYSAVCSSCHGPNGQGEGNEHAGDARGYAVPPLWGSDSFNTGAGMDRLIGAANFIHNNMPDGTNWSKPGLSVPDAWDVAAYVLSQPRPMKAHLDKDYPVRAEKPADSGYGPYVDGFSRAQHRLGPFPPIRIRLAASRPATARR